MHISRFLTFLVIISVGLVGIDPTDVGALSEEGVSFREQMDVEKIRAHIKEIRRKIPSSPGMAVAVIKDDRVIFSDGFGYRNFREKLPVNAQTQFYIASGTKVFTAATAKILAEEGKVDLDVPIKTYLPTLKLKAPLSEDQVTLRDFLTHRGALRSGSVGFRTSYTGQYDDDILLRGRSKYGRTISPAYRYTNIGYIVTGLALEKATNKSWKELTRKKIFDPIGMKNTTSYASKAKSSGNYALPYRYSDGKFSELPYKNDKTMHAAGGTVSSAEDLAKWLIVVMNGGKYKGKQIISSRTVREILSPQINQNRNFYKYNRYASGLGWNLATYKGEEFIHSFGTYAGFRPHTSFMPEHKIGVVVLVNESVESFLLPDLVANEIYDYLLGKRELNVNANAEIEEYFRISDQRRQRTAARRAETTRVSGTKPPTFPLQDYIGIYSNEEFGEFEITIKNNSLFARMGNLYSKLEHENANSFQVDFRVLNPWTITFNSNGSGITEIVSGTDKFLRIRRP